MKKQMLFISLLLSTSIYAVNFRENNSVIQRKTLIVNQLNELEKVHKNLSESEYKKRYKNWKSKIKGLSRKVCVRNGDCTIGADVNYDTEIKASIIPYFERNGEVIRFPNLAFPVHAKVLKKNQISERVFLIQEMYTLTDFSAYSDYKIERRRIYDDFSETQVYSNKIDNVSLGDDNNAKHSVAFRPLDDSIYFDRGYFSIVSQKPIESDFVYISNGAMYTTTAYKLVLKPHNKFDNSEEVETLEVEVLFSTNSKMNYTFNKVIGDGVYQKKDDLIYLANEDFSVDTDFSYEVQPDEGFSAMYVQYGSSSDYWEAAADNKEAIVEFVSRYMPNDAPFDFEYSPSVTNGNVTHFGSRSFTGNMPRELGGYNTVDVFGQMSFFSNNKMVTGLDFGTSYISPKYMMEFLAEQDSLNKLRGIKSKHYRFLWDLYDLMKLSTDTFGSNQGFGIEEIIVPFFWFSSMDEQRQYEPKIIKKFEDFKGFKYHRQSYNRANLEKYAEFRSIKNSDDEILQVMVVNNYISDELMDHFALDELDFKVVLDHSHKQARNANEDYFGYGDLKAYLVCNDLLEDRYESFNSIDFISDVINFDDTFRSYIFSNREKIDKELSSMTSSVSIKKESKTYSRTTYTGRLWLNSDFQEGCSSSRSLIMWHPKYGYDEDYEKVRFFFEALDVFPKWKNNHSI
jgi:hypothetical protein